MISNETVFFIQILAVAFGCIIISRLGYEGLASYVTTLGLLSNLLVCKEIVLFGFTVTASDSLAVGMLLGLNIMQERFGKKATQKAIYTNFCILLAYLVLTQIHLLYTPSPTDICNPHYQMILGFMPRLATASLVTYLIVQLADNALYRWLAKIFNNRFLLMRNALSLSICEALDTVLFSLLGLYGAVSNIGDIIIFSYIIKLITIGCFIPLVGIMKKLSSYDKQNI